jgi:translation initiation factor IF-1
MPKIDNIKLEGKVTEVLPNTMFRVQLETKNIILATLSGKMRQHNIKVLLGDKVELECSVYDLTRGRIVRRK